MPEHLAASRWRNVFLRSVGAFAIAVSAIWHGALPAYADSPAAPSAGVTTSASLTPNGAFADGDLLQVTNDDKIHVVEKGKRRWIADTTSLRRLNPDFSRLRRISFAELDAAPVGQPFRELPLIRDNASGRIYLLTQETSDRVASKHWINDLDSFTKLGFGWSDVRQDWPTAPDHYPDAPALTYRPVSKAPEPWSREGEALTTVPAWRLQTEDERLYLALVLAETYNPDWRAQYGAKLAAKGAWIEWGDLNEAVGGRYQTGLNRITINRRLQSESVGVLASVLSHEVLHSVYDHAGGVQACLAEEVTAFGVGAATWAGLPEKWRSTTEWARSLDALVQAWRRGLVESFVANEPAYQEQCRR
jgi:hypothetical protein